MNREALEVLRQDLRIAKQLAGLAAQNTGFSSLSQSYASQRLLCDTLAALICVLQEQGGPSRTPLRALLSSLNAQDAVVQTFQNDLTDKSSWLYQLADTQDSFVQIFRSKPEDLSQSAAVIASSASAGGKKHWTQIVPEQVERWLEALEAALDAAILLRDEY